MTTPHEYDGHDAEYNGKVDAVVDLRVAGNPTVFARKDGAGADGDFVTGTVGIRTRNGLLLISVMDLEDQECFDVTYRTGDPEVREVRAKDGHTLVRVDDNQRDITALGFVNGTRVGLEDAARDDQYDTNERKVRATGTQGVRTVAIVVDKEHDREDTNA